MRPVNLFLTEDGVLKLGYYGLTTQAECYSIKEMNCDGVRSFAPEVFKGEYEMKSDVWSFGIALVELMGITPFSWGGTGYLPTVSGVVQLPFYPGVIGSTELVAFLEEFFESADERSSVSDLMNVSVMGWRMMSSIHL